VFFQLLESLIAKLLAPALHLPLDIIETPLELIVGDP
jgi:hypothetical protein